MRQFRLAVATLVATFILLLIGGTVNPMGASLACPDWYFVPTCNGELLPEMSGGVLVEHGHRLWASWTGLLTVALAISVWLGRKGEAHRGTRLLAAGAVVLVALQGTLGGVTVLVGLSPTISTLHLVTAMGFFSLLVLLCFRLWPAGGSTASESTDVRRGFVGLAAIATLIQISFGGLVRHLGAGLICGNDWLGCGPGFAWLGHSLAQLHMGHRLIGFVLAFAIVVSSRAVSLEARRVGRTFAARIAWVPTYLILAQVVLGLAAVATGRSVVLITFHTAVASLVFGALVALYLALGPEGSRLDAASAQEADRD